ncbi:MAG: acyl-CoA dehydrogenase family protein, partial [Marinobacter sp.]
MDFNLTEDQLAFREAARTFAEKSMAPHAAKWDNEHIFPVETLKEAGEMGFMGIYTPEALGGMGLSRLDTSVIVEELAAACPSTAAFITIHNMATWMVASFASDDLKQEIVPKLASGEWLASYCLTEPGAGSDAASLRTKAVRDGDSYVINGSKVFISGAGDTDILVLMARTGVPDSGSKGISTFVIPADADGISYGKNEEKMGWHSQPTRTINLENVR